MHVVPAHHLNFRAPLAVIQSPPESMPNSPVNPEPPTPTPTTIRAAEPPAIFSIPSSHHAPSAVLPCQQSNSGGLSWLASTGDMAALNSGNTMHSITSMRIKSGMCVVFQERVEEGMLRTLSRSIELEEVERGRDTSGIPNPEPHGGRFGNTLIRGDYHHVHHGLAKRTISVVGSNRCKYRVISYFYPRDVAYLYGEAPASGPMASAKLMLKAFEKFLGSAGKLVAIAKGSRCLPSSNRPAAPPSPPKSTSSVATSSFNASSLALPYSAQEKQARLHDIRHIAASQREKKCGCLESRNHRDTIHWRKREWERVVPELPVLRRF
ncbi:hypothetical protein BDR26DRAFT_871040 [Obelidium mucronatum]|nr:hypothetical protein BDR26DRAFT_871040 [Obelidium mucronatum]